MANEIRLTHATPSQTDLYVVIRNEATLTVWNGSALVAWSDSDIATYDIPLTDQGGDLYTADAPSSLADGTYRIYVYDAIAATPAITDPLIDSYEWVLSTSGAAASSPGSVAGLTVLEAVNIILNGIGCDDVAELDPGGSSDAGRAETQLNLTTRRLLSKGFMCNTEHDVEFTVDGGGNIPLGVDVLRVANKVGAKNVCRRGSNLYDLDEKTDIFTQSVKATQFLLFDFIDLTPALKDYIASEASIDFQQKVMGSVKLDQFAKDRRKELRMTAEAEEVDTADHNILNQTTAREISGRFGVTVSRFT